MVELAAPGEDWAMSDDQGRLFVSQPEAGRIALVDTISWKRTADLEVGPRPTRVALQQDGRYLWVAHDRPDARDPYVTVIDAVRGRVEAQVPVGPGPHEFAFSARDRRAFVANGGGGTVSAVDTASLRVVMTVPTSPRPVSPSYSAMADAVYVADADGGAVTAIDARRGVVTARIPAGPGPSRLAAAPGGRHVVVVGPERDEMLILDTASNRAVQRIGLHRGPDQVAFSTEFAYVRHRGTEQVALIPLAELGRPRSAAPRFDVPAGQNALGREGRLSPAASIVPTPGMNAVLIANPSDKAIYFYKEGMASPMGNFPTYGKLPRAILVVDRSLREAERPGDYQTLTRLRRSGEFDLIFFLDAPRLVHCFPVDVQADPGLVRKRGEGRSDLEPLDIPPSAAVGDVIPLRFRLLDRLKQAPRSGLVDVNILIYLASGAWQTREWAREAEPGVYAVGFRPPRPGYYFIHVKSDSAGLARNHHPRVVIRVDDKPADKPDPDEARP
jgi:DNA-binding beta-propeller fold protein YncE